MCYLCSEPAPFTIHHSPFTIHHSPFTIHHSPFTIHHSPLTTHHSTSPPLLPCPGRLPVLHCCINSLANSDGSRVQMDTIPRRRDLLLSLKYSTIEACFSVPMLNLTMPNLPFVIAFVVAALHWP